MSGAPQLPVTAGGEGRPAPRTLAVQDQSGAVVVMTAAAHDTDDDGPLASFDSDEDLPPGAEGALEEASEEAIDEALAAGDESDDAEEDEEEEMKDIGDLHPRALSEQIGEDLEEMSLGATTDGELGEDDAAGPAPPSQGPVDDRALDGFDRHFPPAPHPLDLPEAPAAIDQQFAAAAPEVAAAPVPARCWARPPRSQQRRLAWRDVWAEREQEQEREEAREEARGGDGPSHGVVPTMQAVTLTDNVYIDVTERRESSTLIDAMIRRYREEVSLLTGIASEGSRRPLGGKAPHGGGGLLSNPIKAQAPVQPKKPSPVCDKKGGYHYFNYDMRQPNQYAEGKVWEPWASPHVERLAQAPVRRLAIEDATPKHRSIVMPPVMAQLPGFGEAVVIPPPGYKPLVVPCDVSRVR